MTLAYRLVTIVVTDFLCWFPVGILGLLAWRGVSIPGEWNVAVATFTMPINSALNPFLYTLSAVMERRRNQQYERIKMKLECQFLEKFTVK